MIFFWFEKISYQGGGWLCWYQCDTNGLPVDDSAVYQCPSRKIFVSLSFSFFSKNVYPLVSSLPWCLNQVVIMKKTRTPKSDSVYFSLPFNYFFRFVKWPVLFRFGDRIEKIYDSNFCNFFSCWYFFFVQLLSDIRLGNWTHCLKNLLRLLKKVRR